jgi:hypothetical protein
MINAMTIILFSDTKEYPVVGFICQWNRNVNFRSPIGLLQISSHKGNVALFSLGNGQKIPSEIISLLTDKNIVKCGIGAESLKDRRRLCEVLSIDVIGTYDLRYLAQANGYDLYGLDSLAELSKYILKVDLGRNFEDIFEFWNETYSLEQLVYAINSAKASIHLFKKLISNVLWWESKGSILNYCRPNFDKPYIYCSKKR